MTYNRESEIESCLAYTVLSDPDDWIGCPSTKYLDAFLQGVCVRRDFAGPSIPNSRISGVLNERAFYKQFVDATGHPRLTIRWATAIEMTDLSLATGFTKLKNAAIDWHRNNGLNAEPATESLAKDTDRFWDSFAKRPEIYMGDGSGWTLYCFLNGMQKGGDWLDLHPMPRLDDIFGGITRHSEHAYGSPFAAFRVYHATGLLEWVGLPDTKTNQTNTQSIYL